MRRISWIAVCSLLLALFVTPVAADYGTEEGVAPASTAKRLDKSVDPIPARKLGRGVKAYNLACSYTTGSKAGDLRSKAVACRVSDREEYGGQYHLELYKRGESCVKARFGYRPTGYGSYVRLKVYHKATVSGQCPVDVTVNDRTVVSGWSPSSTSWHESSWDVKPYLREGENTIEVRLAQAPKMYWFKKMELSASSDCLDRDPHGGGGGGNWARMLGEARSDFEQGKRAAGQMDYDRARRAFRACIDKARRVETGADSSRLQREARELGRRARYEMQNIGGGGGGNYDQVYKAAYRYAYGTSGLDLSKAASEAFAQRMASEGDLPALERYKKSYRYAYGVSGLDLSKREAIEISWKLMRGDIENFKKLYRYAYGVSGLDLSKQAAIDFAANHIDAPPSYSEDFKRAYRYAYGVSGLDLSKERSVQVAEQVSWYGASGLERFKKDYRYAYSVSGLDLSKEQAIEYALGKLGAY